MSRTDAFCSDPALTFPGGHITMQLNDSDRKGLTEQEEAVLRLRSFCLIPPFGIAGGRFLFPRGERREP